MHRELDPLAADEAVLAGALLLDVREPDEFDAGHAPGALPLPVGQLLARMGELEATRSIVCVCRSGVRSATAADELCKAGYDAANLTGGMLAWAGEGLPVTTDEGRSGVVL
jgi:rhodanese-related sulfurtransferase